MGSIREKGNYIHPGVEQAGTRGKLVHRADTEATWKETQSQQCHREEGTYEPNSFSFKKLYVVK